MDADVFPNTLEYWGPVGMVFFRNIQIRYMPIQGDTRLTFALERPGASGDHGVHIQTVLSSRVYKTVFHCLIFPLNTICR